MVNLGGKKIHSPFSPTDAHTLLYYSNMHRTKSIHKEACLIPCSHVFMGPNVRRNLLRFITNVRSRLEGGLPKFACSKRFSTLRTLGIIKVVGNWQVQNYLRTLRLTECFNRY